MRTDTMLFANDVVATSRWYREFLGTAPPRRSNESNYLNKTEDEWWI